METIRETIEKMGLTYTAEFIPQKFSRNSEDKHKSINWRITISKGKNFITTDYMQGIGHIPKVRKSFPSFDRDNEILASQTGRYNTNAIGWALNPKSLPIPKLEDVLYSLTADSEVCDYCSFEDWADDFGYSNDSIQAKKIYEDCQKIAREFSRIVNIKELQVLFEAY